VALLDHSGESTALVSIRDNPDRPGGSYDFGRQVGRERELERLRIQALAAWPVEARWLKAQGLADGMRVLDVGCGPGFVSEQLAALNPGGKTVGLEPDPELARLADALFASHPGLSLHRGSLANNDLPENDFDFAYARFVMQHLAMPTDGLRSLYRLLKPGGRVLLADADDGLTALYPEPPELREIMRLFEAAQARAGGDRRVGRKLPGLLREAGFTDVGFDVLPFTSHQLGRRALFDIAFSFRLQEVEGGVRGEMEQLVARAREFFASHDWHGVACIVAASGVRP